MNTLIPIAVLVGCLTVLASFADAQSTSIPALFDPPAPEGKPALAEILPSATVSRGRRVQLHSELFTTAVSDRPQHIRLPMFSDREYIARITDAQKLGNSIVSWRGTLEGFANGHFSAVWSAGRMSLHLSDGVGGDYSLRPEPEGGHLLEQTPLTELGTCGTCGAVTAPSLAEPNGANLAPPPPDALAPVTYVDVLILYTPNARLAAGGTVGIQIKANRFIQDSNWRHDRSNTHVRYRLVAWQEINYDDSAQDLARHLTNMTSKKYPGESIQDEVAALRDGFGADFVTLLTHGRANSGSTLGIAAGWPSVVEWSQDTAIFTHELGHSMGCFHEINAADHPPTGNYNLGYEHTETWDLVVGSASEKRVTIMYSGFNPGTRTDYFSNPDIRFTYTGNDCGGLGDGACIDVVHALGVANSVDNARFLRENRATSARLKPARFFLVSEAQGGDGSRLAPSSHLPTLYNLWLPATEALPSDTTVLQLAEGNYTAPIRITQNSRLEKWLGNGKVRIGP